MRFFRATIILTVFLSCLASGQIVVPEYPVGSLTFESAREAYNQGLIKQAEKKIIEALKAYPDNVSTGRGILTLADVYMATGNYKNADAKLAEFTARRQNSPLIAFANLQRAFISLEQKDYPRAVNYLNYSIAQSEKEFIDRNDSAYLDVAHISYYWKGVSLAQQGNYQDAVPAFEACARKFPDKEFADDALYALGQSEEINRKYDEAINYYREISRNYQYSNSYLTALIREANNKLLLRDPSSALVALDRADNVYRHIHAKDSIGLAYEPQSYFETAGENIYYLKGEAYNLAAKFDQAVYAFTAFQETFTDSKLLRNVWLGLGWALLNLGRYDEAIKYYDDIIFKGSENENEQRITAIAQLYRAIGLKLKGDREQAQKELSALAVQSTYPFIEQVLLELGQLYYESEDYEQARRTLERADRESTTGITSVRIHLLLGATYIELKRWDNAITEYSAAEYLALNSSDIFMPQKRWYLAEARFKQGIAMIKSHRSAEAIQKLNTFLGDHQGDPRTEETLFWLADAYYWSEMFHNSINTYNSILENFPGTPRREDVLYGLGWAYFRLKDFKNSSATFNKLIYEYPRTEYAVEVLARQADGYYVEKNFKSAAQYYERAKNTSPNSDEGQYSAYQLCHALYRLGDYEKAITSLMDFVKKYPRSDFAPNSLYLIGWIRFQEKRFVEAIDNFKFLIDSYSQSVLVPRAHYAIGDSYYNMGEYEKSMQAYKTVIESYPSSDLAPEAMKSVQYCLIALGREDEAIKDIDAYISANPTSPFATEFQFKKSELFYTGRKYKDAIAEYESILAKNPDSDRNAEALYWMMKSYINLNDAENAEKTYQKLKSKYPKSEFIPLGMLEMALLNKRNNNIEAADKLFLSLQELYPDHQSAAQAGYERAMIKFNLGDTLTAINLFRDVAEKYKGKEFADQSRWKIAMYYRAKGQNDSARAEFAMLTGGEDRALAAEAQYRIGELWFRDLNYEQAINAFNLVKDNFPGEGEWYPLSLLNLGECYEQLEKWDEAKEIYNSLSTLRPDDDYGKTAKRRLKRIPK